MTSTSTTSPSPPSGFRRADQVSAQLMDGIIDAVASPAGPVARGAVVCRLVREMYDSVAWLHADADGELASLRRLVDQAEAHQARLVAGLTPDLTSGSGWRDEPA